MVCFWRPRIAEDLVSSMNELNKRSEVTHVCINYANDVAKTHLSILL